MPKITATAVAQAPLQDLWDTWDAYPDIYLYNPNIKASYTINNTASTGVGAERQCDLNNGKDWLKERIAVHRPLERLEIDIYDSSMPMKAMRAIFDFRARGANRSQVTMTMQYTPKFGLLGLLMTRPMMRRQLQKLVDASARHAETGATVNPPRLAAVA